jgi:hypothetical protein
MQYVFSVLFVGQDNFMEIYIDKSGVIELVSDGTFDTVDNTIGMNI